MKSESEMRCVQKNILKLVLHEACVETTEEQTCWFLSILLGLTNKGDKRAKSFPPILKTGDRIAESFATAILRFM